MLIYLVIILYKIIVTPITNFLRVFLSRNNLKDGFLFEDASINPDDIEVITYNDNVIPKSLLQKSKRRYMGYVKNGKSLEVKMKDGSQKYFVVSTCGRYVSPYRSPRSSFKYWYYVETTLSLENIEGERFFIQINK